MGLHLRSSAQRPVNGSLHPGFVNATHCGINCRRHSCLLLGRGKKKITGEKKKNLSLLNHRRQSLYFFLILIFIFKVLEAAFHELGSRSS